MGGRISFASNGGRCEGYLALPQSGSGPALIVIQEWWGLVGHITNVADRFAQAGFVVLAPDLYHGVTTQEPDEAKKLLMDLAIDKAALDIAGAAKYLSDRKDVVGKGVGVIGFCMGGSLALWSATLSPEIVATVGFYPGQPWSRMSPIWENYSGKHAIIHCSEHDGTSAAPGIQEALKAIRSAGGSAEAYDYPGTKHAFFNDERTEVYDTVASVQAWERTLAFFNAHIS
ncbi:MAG: dienelactone hydrolase family protein [Actinobacteria bacterium]|nr:dienelactone hydrolase family protein [Actinomycetota bacterium]